MNKKLIGGLAFLVLLTGCSGNNVALHRVEKNEVIIQDGYLIQKQEVYSKQRIKDIIIPEEKGDLKKNAYNY